MAFADPEAKRAYERSYIQKPEVRARRRANYAAWAAANKDKVQDKEARRRLERRASVMIATARTRARKRGLAFDLDVHVEDLQERIDAGRCEITGAPFDLSPGRKFNSPSLDRIDPKAGYTYANVRVVLNLVNAAMGDWGEARLREVMTAWLTP